MRRKIFKVIPWLITACALYYAAYDLDWNQFWHHVRHASIEYVVIAFLCTAISYVARSYRWRYFLLNRSAPFVDAAKTLILGFFMNNVLPARTGELVRAHMGSKVFQARRTEVLASIASERLADGLAISLMLVTFALGLGGEEISQELLGVVAIFFGAALLVIIMLKVRTQIFSVAERIAEKFDHRATSYAANRLQVFIEGLLPLFTPTRIPPIVLWSILVWGVELLVYLFIMLAYQVPLSLPVCVIFLVAVNFSSLIPAAPGGIGVIEAVTIVVLESVGVSRELGLPMVITQHVIQYFVVGIPGILIMVTWKSKLDTVESGDNATATG